MWDGRTRRAAFGQLLVCLLVFFPETGSAAGREVLLTITYYPMTRDAYNGETLINAVLRYPVERAEFPDEPCTQVLMLAGPAFQCKGGRARRLLDACKGHFEGVPKRKPFEHVPEIAFLKLDAHGAMGLLTRYYSGGSGGSRYEWMLHLVRKDNESHYECPKAPILAGIELGPGGHSWSQTYCKGAKDAKQVAKCEERVFYPKRNALRVSFTSLGVLSEGLPPDEPNPRDQAIRVSQ